MSHGRCMYKEGTGAMLKTGTRVGARDGARETGARVGAREIGATKTGARTRDGAREIGAKARDKTGARTRDGTREAREAKARARRSLRQS